MILIPYPHRPALLIIAAMAAFLVTLTVPKPLTAQPEQLSTADTTISSESPSPDSEPQRVQAEPVPDKSGIDSATDVEIQRRLNEFHRELLDDRREFLDKRAKDVDWWLTAIVVFLTFFAIVVAIIGYFGFQRFREIEKEARQSVEALKEQEKQAGLTVEEIEAKHEKAESLLQNMTAETTHSDPDKASEAVETVQQNPLMDQAVADATSLQQQGKAKEAIEKWRSIANIAGADDIQLRARAWCSVGYLYGEEDNREAAIDAYDEAIRLKRDYVAAYNNRGNAKYYLGLHEAALVDYNEAIRLKRDNATVYNNRGVTKRVLGNLNEARKDYQKALALAQESGKEDVIAKAQRNLSQLDNDNAP